MRIENPVIYVPIRHLATGVCQLFSALYICREPSTNQLLFMQNKPNLLDAQMNVSSILTTDYENKSNWTLGENKPNSNPICQRVKLMQSVYLQRIMKKNAAKGYEKTKPKQTQFPKNQNECKLTYNKGLQKKRRFRSPKKQTQFKPNQTQFQRQKNAA